MNQPLQRGNQQWCMFGNHFAPLHRFLFRPSGARYRMCADCQEAQRLRRRLAGAT